MSKDGVIDDEGRDRREREAEGGKKGDKQKSRVLFNHII